MLNIIGSLPTSLPPFTKDQSPKSFLFTRILKNFLGEQAAYIYALLVTNERLTFKRLLQVSRFRPNNLRKILACLIQLNCIVYYPKGEKEFQYYPNEEGCLKLVYADAIITCIRKEYDSETHATIVQNVLAVGHLTIKTFLSPMEKKHEKSKIQVYQKAFKNLVDDGWLVAIGKNSFLSEFDIFDKTFKQATAAFNREHSASKTLSQMKRMAMIKEMTADKFAKVLQNDGLHEKLFDSGTSKFGSGSAALVNPEIPLTLSFERWLKRVRSLHFASEARHSVGEVSAKIYRLVLNRVEVRSREVRSKDVRLQRLLANVGSQITVGLNPKKYATIAEKLSLEDQKSGMLVRVADVYRELRVNGERLGISENDIDGTIYRPEDEEDDNVDEEENENENENENGRERPRPAKRIKLESSSGGSFGASAVNQEIVTLILHHLKLLANNPQLPFLVEASHGVFYVPFTDLSPKLTKHVFKQYLKQVLGSATLRIFNCLEELRLTDEKVMAKRILMKENDIRSDLDRLHKFRLVELQEIPKTQDRSAIRANFAFRPSYETGLAMFSNCMVFNMGEVLEALDEIRLDNKILLDKVSRVDVKGKEKQFLMDAELKELQTFYEGERTLLAKYARLRSAVDVFEFLGGV